MNNKCWLFDCCNHIDCDKEFCLRKYKLDYLYSQANISELQRRPIKHSYTYYLKSSSGIPILETTPDKDVYKALEDIESDIENFVKNGNNLYLHSSNCGNGKTTWAIRLTQAYLNKVWFKCELKCKVLFINVPRFLLELKRDISEKSEYVSHIKENVLDCDLVIWDEIGTKDLTTFEHENVLNLISTRLDSGKSNIYTSNLNTGELYNSIGDRLYSRIVNMSYDISLNGPDMRKIIRDGTTNEIKQP